VHSMRPELPMSAAPTRRTRWAWTALYAIEHFTGSSPIARRAQAMRGQIANAAPREQARFTPVPRVEGLDRASFLSSYVQTDTPVVLAGAARDWPAVAKWTPDWFADRFGDHEVRLLNAAVEDIARPDWRPVEQTLSLREVIETITRGSDLYSRFLPLLHDFPGLAADFDETWLAGLRNSVSTGRNYQLFIGGPGSNTALHTAMGSNLFVQVHGRKRWRIVSTRFTQRLHPAMQRSPYFFSPLDLDSPNLRGVSGWETILEPGDVLYNPPFYWHQVRNLTATIGVGFRYYAPGPIFRSSAALALLTVAARNPPIWTAVQEKKDFTRVFARAGLPKTP